MHSQKKIYSFLATVISICAINELGINGVNTTLSALVINHSYGRCNS